MIAIYVFIAFLLHDVILTLLSRYLKKEVKPVEVVIPVSPAKIELDNLIQEIKRMQAEAAQYNNTETFAKYSKLQRQLIPKQQRAGELEKEVEAEQIPQEQAPQQKPKDYTTILQIIQLVTILIASIFTRGHYFIIESVKYDQLYPINYIIARDTEQGIEISLSYWCLQCFNAIRIIKSIL